MCSKTASRAEETNAVSERDVKGDDNYVGMECRLRSGERERRTATKEETQPPVPYNHRKRESTIGRLPASCEAGGLEDELDRVVHVTRPALSDYRVAQKNVGRGRNRDRKSTRLNSSHT